MPKKPKSMRRIGGRCEPGYRYNPKTRRCEKVTRRRKTGRKKAKKSRKRR